MKRETILLVEDESIIALDIARCLTVMGYEVCKTVSSGEDAIAAVDEFEPGLVLMDIGLSGGMDGIEAARLIRKKHDIPIIYMTANADKATVDRARDTLPYGYLNKPASERDLGSNIDSALHKHRLERRLRQSEEKYRSLVEEINDVVYTVDEYGNITYISPVVREFLQYSAEELIGRNYADFFHPDDVPYLLKNIQQLRSGARNEPHEYRVAARSGEYRWIRASGRTITTGGAFAGMRGVMTDITEQKRTKEALVDSERKYRMVVDNSNDLILVIRNGVILFINTRALELTGYTQDGLTGRSFIEYIHPEDRGRLFDAYRRNLEGESFSKIYDYRVVHRNGTVRSVIISGTPVEWEGEACMLYFLTDITERKQVE